MTLLRAIRPVIACLTLTAALFISGCDKITGKYADSTGMFAVEFKSGKAYLTTAGMTTETPYEVDGDKITLKSASGNLVLTRNSDGSLTGGPLGKLTKQQ